MKTTAAGARNVLNPVKGLIKSIFGERGIAAPPPVDPDNYYIEYETLKKAVRYISCDGLDDPAINPVAAKWREMGRLISKAPALHINERKTYDALGWCVSKIGHEIEAQENNDSVQLPKLFLWSLYSHQNFLNETLKYYKNKDFFPTIDKDNVVFLLPNRQTQRFFDEQRQQATHIEHFVCEKTAGVGHFCKILGEYFAENPVIAEDCAQRPRQQPPGQVIDRAAPQEMAYRQ